jgi:hypothetical protein
MVECEKCDGWGRLWDSSCPPTCLDADHTAECPECHGIGEITPVPTTVWPLAVPKDLIMKDIEDVPLP